MKSIEEIRNEMAELENKTESPKIEAELSVENKVSGM